MFSCLKQCFCHAIVVFVIPCFVFFSYFCTRIKHKLIIVELQFYNVALLFTAVFNLMIAVSLAHNNIWYGEYDDYRRSRLLSALAYTVFAVGFLLHWHFQWRTSWSAAATALSISYFHIGAVLFGWSHTSLLYPGYLTRRVVVRDLLILVLGLTAYVIPLLFPLGGKFPEGWEKSAFIIFFLHASYISFTFYRTYYRVRRSLTQRSADSQSPSWWTAQTKHELLVRHHSFAISCHLIILFGIGSIIITALLPSLVWPYILLLALSVAVFGYIFYSLEAYGSIIEAATNATESVAESQ